MLNPLPYASNRLAVRPHPTGFDRLLWAVFYLGWIALGAAAGFFGGAYGGYALDHLTHLTQENSEMVTFVLGPIVGAAAGGVVGYFARRSTFVHHAMVWVGAPGIVGASLIAYDAYRSKAFLWELGVWIGGLLASAALTVVLSGFAGMSLRRRGQLPPR